MKSSQVACGRTVILPRIATILGIIAMLLAATPFLTAEAFGTVEEDAVSAQLREIIATGRNPHIKWADCTDLLEVMQAFYEQDEYQPRWIVDGKIDPRAREIAVLIADAGAWGLDPTDYEGQRWEGDFAAVDQGRVDSAVELAQIDAGFSISAMRFISALHHGRVNPRRVGFEIDVDEKRHQLWAFMDEVGDDEPVVEVIQQIEPEFDDYELLKEYLARYRTLAAEFSWRRLPDEVVVRPGDAYAESAYLAELLTAFGDLEVGAGAGAGGIYDADLAAAMKRFQARHALDVDGIIGKGSFAELNTPLNHRIEQIELTLERYRWFPQRIDVPVIVVNVPSFTLGCYEVGEDGFREMLAMDVIVGKEFPDRQTPNFAEKMTYLEFAPYWNVPRSIALRSLIPAIEKDPATLDQKDLEIVAHFGSSAEALPPTPENLAKLRGGQLQLRQRPGPQNALGLVKFIMPNAHAVYLHSTPQGYLFERSRRTFSSGCIRVKEPATLAEYVLRGQDDWTLENVEAAMAGDRPQRVVLAEPHWVLILYASAMIGEGGRIHFFDDIYGHDAQLARELARGYPYPQ